LQLVLSYQALISIIAFLFESLPQVINASFSPSMEAMNGRDKGDND